METETVQTAIDWDDVMTDSDFTVATKLLETYRNGDFEELGKALEAFLKNAISSTKYELLVELKNLMEHVLLWKYAKGQPNEAEFCTQERREKIGHHRSEIELSLEMDGCLSEQSILDEWDRAFRWASNLASLYIPKIKEVKELTWKEVFEDRYSLKN